MDNYKNFQNKITPILNFWKKKPQVSNLRKDQEIFSHSKMSVRFDMEPKRMQSHFQASENTNQEHQEEMQSQKKCNKGMNTSSCASILKRHPHSLFLTAVDSKGRMLKVKFKEKIQKIWQNFQTNFKLRLIYKKILRDPHEKVKIRCHEQLYNGIMPNRIGIKSPRNITQGICNKNTDNMVMYFNRRVIPKDVISPKKKIPNANKRHHQNNLAGRKRSHSDLEHSEVKKYSMMANPPSQNRVNLISQGRKNGISAKVPEFQRVLQQQTVKNMMQSSKEAKEKRLYKCLQSKKENPGRKCKQHVYSATLPRYINKESATRAKENIDSCKKYDNKVIQHQYLREQSLTIRKEDKNKIIPPHNNLDTERYTVMRLREYDSKGVQILKYATPVAHEGLRNLQKIKTPGCSIGYIPTISVLPVGVPSQKPYVTFQQPSLQNTPVATKKIRTHDMMKFSIDIGDTKNSAYAHIPALAATDIAEVNEKLMETSKASLKSGSNFSHQGQVIDSCVQIPHHGCQKSESRKHIGGDILRANTVSNSNSFIQIGGIKKAMEKVYNPSLSKISNAYKYQSCGYQKHYKYTKFPKDKFRGSYASKYDKVNQRDNRTTRILRAALKEKRVHNLLGHESYQLLEPHKLFDNAKEKHIKTPCKTEAEIEADMRDIIFRRIEEKVACKSIQEKVNRMKVNIPRQPTDVSDVATVAAPSHAHKYKRRTARYIPVEFISSRSHFGATLHTAKSCWASIQEPNKKTENDTVSKGSNRNIPTTATTSSRGSSKVKSKEGCEIKQQFCNLSVKNSNSSDEAQFKEEIKHLKTEILKIEGPQKDCLMEPDLEEMQNNELHSALNSTERQKNNVEKKENTLDASNDFNESHCSTLSSNKVPYSSFEAKEAEEINNMDADSLPEVPDKNEANSSYADNKQTLCAMCKTIILKNNTLTNEAQQGSAEIPAKDNAKDGCYNERIKNIKNSSTDSFEAIQKESSIEVNHKKLETQEKATWIAKNVLKDRKLKRTKSKNIRLNFNGVFEAFVRKLYLRSHSKHTSRQNLVLCLPSHSIKLIKLERELLQACKLFKKNLKIREIVTEAGSEAQSISENFFHAETSNKKSPTTFKKNKTIIPSLKDQDENEESDRFILTRTESLKKDTKQPKKLGRCNRDLSSAMSSDPPFAATEEPHESQKPEAVLLAGKHEDPVFTKKQIFEVLNLFESEFAELWTTDTTREMVQKLTLLFEAELSIKPCTPCYQYNSKNDRGSKKILQGITNESEQTEDNAKINNYATYGIPAQYGIDALGRYHSLQEQCNHNSPDELYNVCLYELESEAASNIYSHNSRNPENCFKKGEPIPLTNEESLQKSSHFLPNNDGESRCGDVDAVNLCDIYLISRENGYGRRPPGLYRPNEQIWPRMEMENSQEYSETKQNVLYNDFKEPINDSALILNSAQQNSGYGLFGTLSPDDPDAYDDLETPSIATTTWQMEKVLQEFQNEDEAARKQRFLHIQYIRDIELELTSRGYKDNEIIRFFEEAPINIALIPTKKDSACVNALQVKPMYEGETKRRKAGLKHTRDKQKAAADIKVTKRKQLDSSSNLQTKRSDRDKYDPNDATEKASNGKYPSGISHANATSKSTENLVKQYKAKHKSSPWITFMQIYEKEKLMLLNSKKSRHEQLELSRALGMPVSDAVDIFITRKPFSASFKQFYHPLEQIISNKFAQLPEFWNEHLYDVVEVESEEVANEAESEEDEEIKAKMEAFQNIKKSRLLDVFEKVEKLSHHAENFAAYYEVLNSYNQHNFGELEACRYYKISDMEIVEDDNRKEHTHKIGSKDEADPKIISEASKSDMIYVEDYLELPSTQELADLFGSYPKAINEHQFPAEINNSSRNKCSINICDEDSNGKIQQCPQIIWENDGQPTHVQQEAQFLQNFEDLDYRETAFALCNIGNQSFPTQENNSGSEAKKSITGHSIERCKMLRASENNADHSQLPISNSFDKCDEVTQLLQWNDWSSIYNSIDFQNQPFDTFACRNRQLNTWANLYQNHLAQNNWGEAVNSVSDYSFEPMPEFYSTNRNEETANFNKSPSVQQKKEFYTPNGSYIYEEFDEGSNGCYSDDEEFLLGASSPKFFIPYNGKSDEVKKPSSKRFENFICYESTKKLVSKVASRIVEPLAWNKSAYAEETANNSDNLLLDVLELHARTKGSIFSVEAAKQANDISPSASEEVGEFEICDIRYNPQSQEIMKHHDAIPLSEKLQEQASIHDMPSTVNTSYENTQTFITQQDHPCLNNPSLPTLIVDKIEQESSLLPEHGLFHSESEELGNKSVVLRLLREHGVITKKPDCSQMRRQASDSTLSVSPQKKECSKAKCHNSRESAYCPPLPIPEKQGVSDDYGDMQCTLKNFEAAAISQNSTVHDGKMPSRLSIRRSQVLPCTYNINKIIEATPTAKKSAFPEKTVIDCPADSTSAKTKGIDSLGWRETFHTRLVPNKVSQNNYEKNACQQVSFSVEIPRDTLRAQYSMNNSIGIRNRERKLKYDPSYCEALEKQNFDMSNIVNNSTEFKSRLNAAPKDPIGTCVRSADMLPCKHEKSYASVQESHVRIIKSNIFKNRTANAQAVKNIRKNCRKRGLTSKTFESYNFSGGISRKSLIRSRVYSSRRSHIKTICTAKTPHISRNHGRRERRATKVVQSPSRAPRVIDDSCQSHRYAIIQAMHNASRSNERYSIRQTQALPIVDDLAWDHSHSSPNLYTPEYTKLHQHVSNFWDTCETVEAYCACNGEITNDPYLPEKMTATRPLLEDIQNIKLIQPSPTKISENYSFDNCNEYPIETAVKHELVSVCAPNTKQDQRYIKTPQSEKYATQQPEEVDHIEYELTKKLEIECSISFMLPSLQNHKITCYNSLQQSCSGIMPLKEAIPWPCTYRA